MNKNSNLYTIAYAAIMVIVVAIGLAFTSQSLKEHQRKNLNIDRMQQILRAINVKATNENTIQQFGDLITDAFLVDAQGAVVAGSNGTDESSQAFNAELSKLDNAEAYPVFVANVEGETKYILGMYGKGLWGPVWGYISLDEDRNTVFGVDFSHQGETPGLGAQIVEEWFRAPFKGKHIFDANEQFRSIAVVKKGSHAEDGQDYVDGISGSTLTSNGVHHMLYDSIKKYELFLKTK